MIDQSHKFKVGEDCVVIRWNVCGGSVVPVKVSRVAKDIVSVKGSNGKFLHSFKGPNRVPMGTHYGSSPMLLTPAENTARLLCDRALLAARGLDKAIRTAPMGQLDFIVTSLEAALKACKEP
jgi:hypothetical protein